MEEAAEPVAAADPAERDCLDRRPFGRWRFAERRPLSERSVRPVLVVMSDIDGENLLKVVAAED